MDRLLRLGGKYFVSNIINCNVSHDFPMNPCELYKLSPE